MKHQDVKVCARVELMKEIIRLLTVRPFTVLAANGPYRCVRFRSVVVAISVRMTRSRRVYFVLVIVFACTAYRGRSSSDRLKAINHGTHLVVGASGVKDEY